eukprot:3152682-Rhodomonas_salina.1
MVLKGRKAWYGKEGDRADLLRYDPTQRRVLLDRAARALCGAKQEASVQTGCECTALREGNVQTGSR